jgi:translation initiation factor 1 (eIF-1/SUI1)
VRGGKTVTIITGFMSTGHPEKPKLMQQMQKVCGSGGTVKEGGLKFREVLVI